MFLAPLSRDELEHPLAQPGVSLPALVCDVMRRKLLRRMRRQKGELSLRDLEEVERRAGSAYGELRHAHSFDHVIPNHDGAAKPFKSAVTKDKWDAALTALQPLGRLKSRALKSRQYSENLPGAPDGKYVVIQYDSVFENKASAVETVTPMLEADGVWRVSGYFVK